MHVQHRSTPPNTISAEQWLNTPESLTAIQHLLAPGSPLADGFGLSKSLGVYVKRPGSSFPSTELKFADVNSWITRDGDRIEIYTQEEFEARFELAPTFSVTGVRMINATHPRALGTQAAEQPVEG